METGLIVVLIGAVAVGAIAIKVKFFPKQEEKLLWPQHYALIKLSDHAKSMGITDNENKVLVRVLNGKEVERIPYTDEDARAMRDTEEIPIEEEKFINEDFEFDTIGGTGETTIR